MGGLDVRVWSVWLVCAGCVLGGSGMAVAVAVGIAEWG